MSMEILSPELLHRLNAHWRAANHQSVSRIYVYDNFMLKRPLRLPDVKRPVVGHWRTTSGQNLIYMHLPRVIKKYDLNMLKVAGPGHGGPRPGQQYVSRRYLQRMLPRREPRRSRTQQDLPEMRNRKWTVDAKSGSRLRPDLAPAHEA